MRFHLSLAGSRTDTITVESPSKSKLLEFFNKVSLSVVRNIKEIVFSKDYNINYVDKPFISQGRYKKVIVTALSATHSKIFTLFNIKITVSKEQIMTEFKKLLIENEPIIDFTSILFFQEGDLSPISKLNLYQIQYKRNGKTYVEDFHSSSWQILKGMADTLIDGEITEIRKYVHTSNIVKTKVLTNCYASVNVNIYDDVMKKNFKITNVKRSYDINILKTDIQNVFTLSGKKVDSNNIKLTFR